MSEIRGKIELDLAESEPDVTLQELSKRVKALDEKYKLEPEATQKALYYSQWEKARNDLLTREKEMDEGGGQRQAPNAPKRGDNHALPAREAKAGPKPEATAETKAEKKGTRKMLEHALRLIEGMKGAYAEDTVQLGRIAHTLNAARSALSGVKEGGKYKGTSAVSVPGEDGQIARVQYEGVPVDEVIALLKEGAAKKGEAQGKEFSNLAGDLAKASSYYFDVHFPKSGGG